MKGQGNPLKALLASLLVLVTVTASTELTCEKDDNGTLVCSFRVNPSLISNEKQLKACTESICVEAVVSTHPNPSNPSRHEKEQTPGVLYVGKATYRQPYSQYPPDVAAWLQQAPKTSIDSSPLEWAQWCGNLGTFHLANAVEWYDLELAINALDQSLLLIHEQTNTDSLFLQGYEEFTASVESNLGEAYYLDPQVNHFPQSLEHYEKALEIYKFLLQDETQVLPPNDQINRKLAFARINAKVGMTRLQMHPSYAKSIVGNGMPGEYLDSVTKLLNPEEDTQDSLGPAKEAFATAIDIYRPRCEELSMKDDPAFFVQTCLDYVSTLQYAGTAESASGNLPKAEQFMIKALEVYFGGENILEETDNTEDALKNVYNTWYASGAVDSIANLLVSIANFYSQLGQYDKSKSSYGLAMTFYSKFHIAVPPIVATTSAGGLDLEETQTDSLLDQYLGLLTAYRRGTGQTGPPQHAKGNRGISHEDHDQTKNLIYQRDDTYEGDVVFNLGTIYLSMGDDDEAVSWFEQAIELYENEGDERKVQIASAKTNLALLYFRMGRFVDSELAHFDSLDIYQALYGDGVNPYLQGLEEYQEELRQAMEQPGVKSSKAETASTDGGIAGGIDLKKYKQSIQNATEASAATNEPKEEL
jgi:tetratricopeptide (TPR) repeat protein